MSQIRLDNDGEFPDIVVLVKCPRCNGVGTTAYDLHIGVLHNKPKEWPVKMACALCGGGGTVSEDECAAYLFANALSQ